MERTRWRDLGAKATKTDVKGEKGCKRGTWNVERGTKTRTKGDGS